ncbi:MAG TPA: NPCBM/NEW2 domain-containing protein [Pirellulales bacterium]|nr:NPCBM/NEW2 domain-containing protein [Pirellulales bacterium]
MLSTLIAAALVFAPLAARSADETGPAPLQAVVTTADDEQIGGTISGLSDGRLSLAGEPPRVIDLSDLQRIEFGRQISASSSSAGDLAWIGQDNHDLVQVGGASGGNGIQDLHLHAGNLKPLAIKQIIAVCRFPNQLRVWRLDTSQSPHWRLAIARADLASEAELYLEPPSNDAFGLKLDLTITYSDGANGKSSTTATTHTSDQLKVDRAAQPGQAAAKTVAPAVGKAEVFLADKGRVRGEVVEITPESMLLRMAWKTDLPIPILQVRGIWFGNAAPAETRADFDKKMSVPAGEDVAYLIGRDKIPAQISGSVAGLSGGKMTIRFEGSDRSVNGDRLLGLVFAAHPKIPLPSTPYHVFMLNSGDSISGRWTGLKEDNLEIETLWQSRFQVPAGEVAEIRSRNGRLIFLGDLDPISVEEVPYFGRVIHWARDQGFDDAPAKVKGKQPSRSIAMHSRSVLTYALDEQFEKFKATLGFDDSAGTRGRVACRVIVDGRESFVQKDLRSDQDPVNVEVPLGGAKQFALEVDFGEAEDIGDRVIWAEPRLFRAAVAR